MAAGTRYGRSDITKDMVIASRPWVDGASIFNGKGSTCEEKLKNYFGVKEVICVTEGKDSNGNPKPADTSNMYQDDSTAAFSLSGNYWSSVEVSITNAMHRNFNSHLNNPNQIDRKYTNFKALCVGD